MKLFAATVLVFVSATNAQLVEFRLIDAHALPGAEVVTYEPSERSFWCTGAEGVFAYARSEGGWTRRSSLQSSDFAFTHVTADRGGSGVVLATAQAESAITAGRLLMLDPVCATPLGNAVDQQRPDCVILTDDGSTALLALENEPSAGGPDLPGGVTICSEIPDLGGDPSGLLTAVYHIPERLLIGVKGLRIHPDLRDAPAHDVEPEYIAVYEGTAYITLQENNAIGVFDIDARAWTDIIPIPVITNTIDASDRDGINIDDAVMCMPMPDQIVAADGYLFFPGEGDTRSELGEGGLEDHARLKDLVDEPADGLGRLKVCAFTGDTDDDGVIDVPHAFGSRAVHRYDLETKEWAHTGSLIERTIAERFPEHWPEDRCDDRGPEPEGITTGVIDGRTVLFVSIERPGAVMAFDTELNLLGVVMSAADGHTAPEGLCFVGRDQSPLGVDTLAVAFEASGHVVFYEVSLNVAGAEDK